MLVVDERGDELLRSKFVRGWVNYVLVVGKSTLEMKIEEPSQRARPHSTAD